MAEATGAYYLDQTVLNPAGLAAILLLGVSMLVLPRRYAVWPMIIMGSFVAPAQRIAVFTLNFDLLRLMVLFGSLRLFFRQEWRGFVWKGMDWVLVIFALVSATIYIVQYGTLDVVKYKLGVTYDMIGMYFLFRMLVRDVNDVASVGLGFAVVSLPVALAFLVERSTGQNMFATFGGVPEITMLREGRMRCQGAYAHPILAGCYWASALPLMAGLWWTGKWGRYWAAIGLLCGLTVVALCASSTPVAGVLAGVIGAAMFPIRRHLRWVRWGIASTLVGLHLVMKAPVWHLISRLDFAGGSEGWHRFNVIDQFVRHFSEWWMLGVRQVEPWGIYENDVTNQYLAEATRGGLASMVLLILLVVLAFKRIGLLWRAPARQAGNIVWVWALGTSLLVHCIMFFGVNYFGQIITVWYLLLAMIGSLAPSATHQEAVAVRQPVQTFRRTPVPATFAVRNIPRGSSPRRS